MLYGLEGASQQMSIGHELPTQSYATPFANLLNIMCIMTAAVCAVSAACMLGRLTFWETLGQEGGQAEVPNLNLPAVAIDVDLHAEPPI